MICLQAAIELPGLRRVALFDPPLPEPDSFSDA
jgi:hypothetical protein